jgi:hypothetical protein
MNEAQNTFLKTTAIAAMESQRQTACRRRSRSRKQSLKAAGDEPGSRSRATTTSGSKTPTMRGLRRVHDDRVHSTASRARSSHGLRKYPTIAACFAHHGAFCLKVEALQAGDGGVPGAGEIRPGTAGLRLLDKSDLCARPDSARPPVQPDAIRHRPGATSSGQGESSMRKSYATVGIVAMLLMVITYSRPVRRRSRSSLAMGSRRRRAISRASRLSITTNARRIPLSLPRCTPA